MAPTDYPPISTAAQKPSRRGKERETEAVEEEEEEEEGLGMRGESGQARTKGGRTTDRRC